MMRIISMSCIVWLLCCMCHTDVASAHTFLFKPTPRHVSADKDHLYVKRSESACGSTRIPSKLPHWGVGSTVPMSWWRNNHIGGFVRYAITPLEQSLRDDAQTSFDKAVVHYACNQVECQGYGDNFFNGDGQDVISEDSGTEKRSNPCKGSLKIPLTLKVGQRYTMQWTWYGQGSSHGIMFDGQVPYVSCVDFLAAPGNGLATRRQLKKVCNEQRPTFNGGDLYTQTRLGKDNVCVAFKPDRGSNTCLSDSGCKGTYWLSHPNIKLTSDDLDIVYVKKVTPTART